MNVSVFRSKPEEPLARVHDRSAFPWPGSNAPAVFAEPWQGIPAPNIPCHPPYSSRPYPFFASSLVQRG